MPQEAECIADDGRVHVVKLHPQRRRTLKAEAFSPDGQRVGSASLSKHVDQAVIEGLDPDTSYRVRVRPTHGFRSLRRRSRTDTFAVQPRTHDLRLLITGSGRCGTTTLADYLDGQRFDDGTLVRARHEPLAYRMLDAFIAGDQSFPVLEQRGALHNVESAPYYSIYPDVIRADAVVLLIRDGRRVVQSGLNRGWYARASPWDYIKPDFGLDQFESCCRLWTECEHNMASRADHVFRLEDLVRGGDHLRDFDRTIGLMPNDKTMTHTNRGATTSTGFLEWTAEQRESFETICGEVMDRHYPGWREAGREW